MKEKTTIAPATTYSVADPRNPDYQSKARTKKVLMIGFIIMALVGLVLVGRKHPKATIGTIAGLFIALYLFMPQFDGPSRFKRWTSGNQYTKTPRL